MKFRSDIEGLRGVAVLFVVLFHAGLPWMPGGFVGVDVFFVLSGYLISGLLISERESTGSISFPTFYARRSARLLPAAVLVICTTLAAATVFLSPPEVLRVGRTAIRALLYVSNISFARNTGYFEALVDDDVLLHTWSLGVEEQFYVGWPLFIAALGAIGIARGRRLGWVLGSVALVSFIASLVLTFRTPAWAFFLTPLRAWEFAVGAMAYVWASRTTSVSARLIGALGALGAAALIASAMLITEAVPYPGVAALLPVGGTAALLIAGAVAPQTISPRSLGIRPLRWLGKMSYGLYLWHWPVLAIGALVFGLTDQFSRLALCVFALLLSVVSYSLVEAPLRRLGARSPHRGVVIAAFLLLSVVSAGAAWAVNRQASRRMTSPRQIAIEAARGPGNTETPRCQTMVGYTEIRSPVCLGGDTTSAHLVLLIGDSKAGHWWPALQAIGRQRGWKVRVLAKAGCPLVDIRPFYLRAIRQVYDACNQWRENTIQTALSSQPALILIASSGKYAVGPDAVVTLDEWRDGTERLLGRLRDGGLTVGLFRDTPLFPMNVPDCLGRPGAIENGGVRCSRERAAAVASEPFGQTRAAMAAVGGRLFTIDLSDVFCPRSSCPVIFDGVIGYKDADHLTIAMSTRLADPLMRRIDEGLRSLPAPGSPAR
jgi:peptidoglycan/LPS O-acetylase OafA/YrhL